MSFHPVLLFVLTFALVLSSADRVRSDELSPKKYALLVGVSVYEHAEMNKPQPLEFPEADAKAVAALLAKSGYTVSVLVDKEATRERIVTALNGLKHEGNDSGAILVGFFGHGVEYEIELNGQKSSESYFCPYDVELRVAKDKDGRKLAIVEADPDTAVGMTDVFLALRLSKAGRRIVLADCCRNDPNAARGRSFGANVKSSDIPERTAALFACSSGEKAFEDKVNGHGVFTQALLDRISSFAGDTPLTAGALGEYLELDVPQRVSQMTNGREKQTPRYFSSSRVDLQLRRIPSSPVPPQPTKPAKPTAPPLFNFVDSGKSSGQALVAQQAWANFQSIEVDRVNSLGMRFRLLPPGEFMMGSTESKSELESMGVSTYKDFDNGDEQPQHSVQISKSMYVGVHEVTLGQFLKYYEADKMNHKTDAEKDAKGGFGFDGAKMEQNARYFAWNTGWNNPVEQYMDHPCVNVSWNDSVSFCEWLTKKERSSGQIRPDQEYRLLDEAQWEYAARGGSRGLYGFGNDPKELTKHGNVKDSKFKERFSNRFGDPLSGSDGYVFTSPVGKYKPNGFGLYDMHGNVWEWCQDGYNVKAYSNRRSAVIDPFVTEGEIRISRGGCWSFGAVLCRSAFRDGDKPGFRCDNVGFRISLQSVR